MELNPLFPEIQRLVARCPRLRRHPGISVLLDKGHAVAEEEVVEVLAGVSLHPEYTIPILSCLRCLAKKLLERTVALLRVVPNLGTNSGAAEEGLEVAWPFRDCQGGDAMEVDEEDKELNVIESYSREGRGLDLHELACFAFSRALDLLPFLKGYVQCYFEFSPPPFARIQNTSNFMLSSEISDYLLHIVRLSYRLLHGNSEHYSSHWNWCWILDLLKQCGNTHLDDNTEYMKNIYDINWCGTQILSLLLQLPNKASPSFCLKAEEAMSSLLRWQEFCWDVSLEQAGWFLSGEGNFHFSERYEGEMDQASVSSIYRIETEHLQASGRTAKWNDRPFVMTSAVKKSFQRVVLAVNQKWPVLLHGSAGCGKTALINKLVSESGGRVLSIHMDDQMDGKTLIGSYVCTEQPGEFRWQPGSLTQAVASGLWVVFENIDQAPSDVHSVLLPLMEGRNYFVTGHDEAVKVNEGFRLFSTISTQKLDSSVKFEGSNTLSSLWRKIMIAPPSNEDIKSIVTAVHPDLDPIAQTIIDIFVAVSVDAGCSSRTPCTVSSFSRFSLRDILKFCKRVAGYRFGFTSDIIYKEAMDIFGFASSGGAISTAISETIGRICGVPSLPSSPFYCTEKPIFEESGSSLRIGRVTLQYAELDSRSEKKPFVQLHSSLAALERIACSVKYNEPVLLVGETGTGKTTLVQYLATRLGQKLTVLNLSQQSDIADLLGGVKPVDARSVCIPLYKEFLGLLAESGLAGAEDCKAYLMNLQKIVGGKNWNMLLKKLKKVAKRLSAEKINCEAKRRKRLETNLLAWGSFSLRVDNALRQITSSSGMLFSFVEGAFITALKKGDWILLDEVNLAPAETLQRIIGVLEGENGSLCLAEKGDVDYLQRNPNFRIFACMNPANDAGKRDLPYSLRSRFTEYFVNDVMDEKDLTVFVGQFIDSEASQLCKCPHSKLVDKIVKFYIAAKEESESSLQDGANQKPQYSLRSLFRALEYTRTTMRKFGFQRALYDGFAMFFMTLLDRQSAVKMAGMILDHLLDGKSPEHTTFDKYLFDGARNQSNISPDNYVLTKSVRTHLTSLARAMLIKRYPVLLQGPTSSGKTSMVRYLAELTDHEFVRINNHEHTDLQEYLGSYITDHTGELVFHEGVLVKAVRSGQWIVLDELNLAPSDVLEALNRLLDDNRELFVPELQETVRAHPDFMLFATQNPPTFYGGRKMLSRAFRNRFVEIQVDEIPDEELSTILEERCKVPKSYAEKMVGVMKDLQLHRRGSKVFAGKHGFITPRDLFRWAQRFHKSEKSSREDLALDGYLLLAERLRDETEKNDVLGVLKNHLGAGLVLDNLYEQGHVASDPNLIEIPTLANCGDIIWTKSMRRLYFLVKRCYEMREPVLLVGETGGGKTTVCQLLSMVLGSKLHILNCHQYTETSDFIGGFFPLRERSRIVSEFKSQVQKLLMSKPFTCSPDIPVISEDINHAAATLEVLRKTVSGLSQGQGKHSHIPEKELATFEQTISELSKLQLEWQTIFTWQDGPLVHAMKHGDLFLVDEISLADDSVLERLNSVLEPERKLALAEKGGPELEKLTANPNFFLLATMNPGGDYGKKELSPALRNRFTEIWVPSVCGVEELGTIAAKKFSRLDLARVLVGPMLNFWEWFDKLQTGRMLTVRDLLSWVAFINATEESLSPEYAFLHGAFLVLLDGLSLGTGITEYEAMSLRNKCLDFMVLELQKMGELDPHCSKMGNFGWNCQPASISKCGGMECVDVFGIHPFYIKRGDDDSDPGGFELLAPTTRRNALRILRAMQLSRPVLLEGSPGVGKTSLIVALGKYSGHKVVRINLSEQTDLMDLLGSDLPIESDTGIQFAWSDGILLQALKDGAWVLLDELNLAPQSVLEGLNAILVHRAEVFIPELGLTFKCPPSFRVFACQNPTYQGGGRKGLPKSFLNRFTKVYVDQLDQDDYHAICSSLFPDIPTSMLKKLIQFNKRLYEETMLYHKFAQDGSPWEFNLRDVIRSCQIIKESPVHSDYGSFLNVVYIQRMRTAVDRKEVLNLYTEVFGGKPYINPYPRIELKDQSLLVGSTHVRRSLFNSAESDSHELKILPEIGCMLEAASQCVKLQWLCILVGPTSSGKTSLLRLLAQLTGNILHEINLSSATDISELLGCFEQYNAFRNYRSVVSQVEYYVKEYCNQLLSSLASKLSKKVRDFMTERLAFLSNVNLWRLGSSTSTETYHWGASLPLLEEVILILRSDLETDGASVSYSSDDLGRALHVIQKLRCFQCGSPIPVKFEWAAGLLVRAIENGEWIVLEDANLCNPTVLDRINSLAESNGSITVNECGNVDGKPLTLLPHPNFRLFLTVNPMYGEVSRAMRNRGVEIFMMKPHWILEGEECDFVHEKELTDVKRFLALSNIPNSVLVDLMAKAHMYALNEGLRCNVKISYLELTRWVQLFRQLIMNGNQLLGSLHLSWEHIYLSSFGESQGWDIVNHAKASYFSLVNLNSLQGPLTVLGGWPMPLSVRDFISFPKEASVKKNCVYLQLIGSEYATYQRSMCKKQSKVDSHVKHPQSIYLIDTKTLGEILYPGTLEDTIINHGRSELNKVPAHDMLMFAANWMIEQATECDFELYLCWLSWYSSQLQPYCQFFQSFLEILREEQKHPLWKCIYNTRRYAVECDSDLNLHLQSLPLLSFESAALISKPAAGSSSSKELYNAINCVGLLRRTFWQWRAEDNHDYDDKSKSFVPVLESLRMLERQFLSEIVKGSHFDIYFQLYDDLLNEHFMFWNCVAMSHFDYLLLHWRSLIKKSVKLELFCPEAVKMLLEVSNRPPWPMRSCKPMLWVHGGHPFMPSTADVYNQLKQLYAFSEGVWSARKQPSAILDDCLLIEFAVSLNSAFRLVALEGLCMSSYIMHEDDKTADQVVQQLVEIHQLLSERYQHEKQKLKELDGIDSVGSDVVVKISCCSTSPEMLCSSSGFDCWLQAVSVADQRSLLLDLPLLQKLPENVVADTDTLNMALSCLSGDLESALQFSLKFSSRSPVDLLAHQKILWTLDAWASATAVDVKIASSTQEMWFRWHSFLWNNPSLLRKMQDETDDDCNMSVIPNLLFRPVMTQLVEQTVESAFKLNEYFLLSLRVKAGSRNIWQSAAASIDLNSSLLHAAHSLLQQIIFAHKKSFSKEKFASIQAIYLSALTPDHLDKESDIQALVSLLKYSAHKKFTSVIQPLLEPLLQEIYLKGSSHGALYNTGRVWRMLGELRFQLLIGLDDLDPAAKFMSKYTQVKENISSLELEMKVRQECNYLSGSSSNREIESRQFLKLRELDSERKMLQRKIVFREDPGKFKKLKNECEEFLKFASSSKLGNFERLEIVQFLNKAKNWQETASSFIGRLSDEYAGYADIIQPIQVAVYEMKLGVSLVVSSVLEKNFLHVIQEEGVTSIMNAVCAFMRFPRQHAIHTGEAKLSLSTDPLSTNRSSVFGWAKGIGILQKFVKDFVDVHSGNKVSPSLSQDTLGRVMQGVANTQLMDPTSFLVLDELFKDFASIWVTMKADEEIKKGSENQEYKFKPRRFEIDIGDIDVSSLGDPSQSSTFAEWNEYLCEDGVRMREATVEYKTLSMWNAIEESALNNVVAAHSRLFGSLNLLGDPRSVRISDASRLLSFIGSYTMGAKMVKDLGGISSFILDTKLVPEHLFRLCLEHEQKLSHPCRSAQLYNFYKDANSSALVSLVKLLVALQKRVSCLLSEWEEHPGLQRICNIVEMLLAIPLSTPLAKVLSGVQFLFSRFRTLQEEGFKFPLKEEFEPIHALACSWQRMEVDSWCTALDEVQVQFERNAEKLWFPLYSVLHPEGSADIDNLVQSLGEFIETSNVGEFRKRLQLVLAFHGQATAGVCLGSYTSSFQIATVKILYNLFGAHIQLLPIVMEHVSSARKRIEKKLEELVKLCHWNDKLMSIEDSKRYRQKLKKIVQDYTEILQQPTMLIIQQKSGESELKVQHLSQSTQKIQDFSSPPRDLLEFSETERTAWHTDWRMKVEDALENMPGKWNFESEYAKYKKCSVSSLLTYQQGWIKVWSTLENIYVTAVDCASIWNEEGKNQLKLRALDHLLKFLEESGLAKHKSAFPVIHESDQDSAKAWWLFLPSYEMKHLLAGLDVFSGQELNVGYLDIPIANCKKPLFDEEWREANQFYFKSMASVFKLSNLCVNTLQEQVGRSRSFMSQLVVTQQDQRDAAYNLSKNVKKLRDCFECLKNACTFLTSFEGKTDNGSLTVPNQCAMIWCLWRQKDIFDTLLGISEDEILLLKTVCSAHLSCCETVKPAAIEILGLIERHIGIFRNSKVLLDRHLLDDGGPSIKLTSMTRPVIVSKEVELLIIQNFKAVQEFEDACSSHLVKLAKGSVEDVLLGYFHDVILKAKKVEEEYLKGKVECFSEEDLSETALSSSLDNTFGLIMEGLKGLSSRDSILPSEANWEKFSAWKSLLEPCVQDIKFSILCEEVTKIISYAVKLTKISKQSSNKLLHLQFLLDLVLTFCDGLLRDFLITHKTVAILTHTLAETFTMLFSKGFRSPNEDPQDEISDDATKDASGTGMGEGIGAKDVSDQITDEDQLLGTTEKNEEENGANQLPSKNDKGIEMEEDFEADAHDLSEDSGGDDDGVEEEEEKLDSEMGKAGDDKERVNEKLSSKEEDEKVGNDEEKNDSGPSVKDEDCNTRELRGKEEDHSLSNDELEGAPNNVDEEDTVEPAEDGSDDMDDKDGFNTERKDALPGEEGLELNEPDKKLEEDGEMDADLSDNPMEDGEIDENDCDINHEVDTEMDDPMDEADQEGDHNQAADAEEDESKNNDEGNGMDSRSEPKSNDYSGHEDLKLQDDLQQSMEAPLQSTQNLLAPNPSSAPEVKWSTGTANQSDFTQSDGTSQMEIMLENSKGEKQAQGQPKPQAPEQDSSSKHKDQPNPLRSIGDALQGWKERVQVSIDVQDDNRDPMEDVMDDDDAVDYGFTSELDKGTAQAQGSAMPDQAEQNMSGDRPDQDRPELDDDYDKERKTPENKDSEPSPVESHAVLRREVGNQAKLSSLEELPGEEMGQAQNHVGGDSGSAEENIVSVEKSHMQEDMNYQFRELSVDNHQLRKVEKFAEISTDLKNSATEAWRKYELRTERMSQELSEQLRLIMEPTLASKLQGDYRTGKRINMKKVIPYIASHYRKDKIWLRRTRPNKRDYQVVIAVDDSRSMLESGCGNFAIEALITVCRAMSQLEVGKLAVASFGKEGNLKLLHDFEQPFTREAGVNMISSFTFEQENTIVDEPMVDLMNNLNGMLDEASVNARLPSGQNPLQQLVLIIADGRFHEKEKLKPRVRELLNQRRMVAFLLLDSPTESIMDLQEASFQGGQLKITKYLDSFPFPYYIILKNIDALPRTLADLLRQWFEVLQNSRD